MRNNLAYVVCCMGWDEHCSEGNWTVGPVCCQHDCLLLTRLGYSKHRFMPAFLGKGPSQQWESLASMDLEWPIIEKRNEMHRLRKSTYSLNVGSFRSRPFHLFYILKHQHPIESSPATTIHRLWTDPCGWSISSTGQQTVICMSRGYTLKGKSS